MTARAGVFLSLTGLPPCPTLITGSDLSQSPSSLAASFCNKAAQSHLLAMSPETPGCGHSPACPGTLLKCPRDSSQRHRGAVCSVMRFPSDPCSIPYILTGPTVRSCGPCPRAKLRQALWPWNKCPQGVGPRAQEGYALASQSLCAHWPFDKVIKATAVCVCVTDSGAGAWETSQGTMW